MFVYDGDHDEFNEVFDDDADVDEIYQTNYELHLRKRSSISSFKSSRHSIKGQNGLTLSRIITKSGRINVFHNKIPKKYFVYIRDLGNTLLNIRWRWIITTIFAVHVLSFLIFGLLWMYIAYLSGDFEKDAKNICIVNTRTFTGYVMLSIETMLTIGYGYRYPTENCVQGWIVPFLQALISVGIQGVLVSALYVKIAKPITKNFLGLFSDKAVICMRDSRLCFIFRIADLFGKVAIGTSIKAYFINKNLKGDDFELFHIQRIQIEEYGFSIFPLEISHVIDDKSPFWKITPYDLLMIPIEIVVVVEGVSSITGQPSQNRVSYTNSNILWGHRFTPCVHFDNKKEKYVVNCKNINSVYAFDTPLCSAHELNLITDECFQ